MHGVLYRVHTPEPMYSIFDDYEACNEGWPEPYELLLRPTDVILRKRPSDPRRKLPLYMGHLPRDLCDFGTVHGHSIERTIKAILNETMSNRR